MTRSTSERVFNLISPTDPSILFSVTSIDFEVSNYSAEELVSDSLPAENRHLPIGAWFEAIDSVEGEADVLCRAVNSDLGGVAYNCRNTFDVQGFSGINGSFSQIGADKLHLLVRISSTTNSGGLADSTRRLSFITSLPVILT